MYKGIRVLALGFSVRSREINWGLEGLEAVSRSDAILNEIRGEDCKSYK